MTSGKISVIMTTYNAPRFLEYCLLGFHRQTYQDFEVVIADDGSTEDTVVVIHEFRKKFGMNIRHVWQEDLGYRKCHILNKGIEASKADYLIFTDGDCVPHSMFVQDHLDDRQAKTALTGRRVKWGKKFTEGLTREYIATGKYERIDLKLIKSVMSRDTKRLTRGIRLANNFVGKILNYKEKRLVGCNFSVEKEAMEIINGFDEDYIGPGVGDDRDVHIRLKLAGYRIKSLMNKALQYHLFHPASKRPPQQWERFSRLKRERWVQCANGLKKL